MAGATIGLSEAERRELRRRAAQYTRPHREMIRAEVVLLAAEGHSDAEIAEVKALACEPPAESGRPLSRGRRLSWRARLDLSLLMGPMGRRGRVHEASRAASVAGRSRRWAAAALTAAMLCATEGRRDPPCSRARRKGDR